MDKNLAKSQFLKSLDNLRVSIDSEAVSDDQRIFALTSVSLYVDFIVHAMGSGPPIIPVGTQQPTSAFITCPRCSYNMSGSFK